MELSSLQQLTEVNIRDYEYALDKLGDLCCDDGNRKPLVIYKNTLKIEGWVSLNFPHFFESIYVVINNTSYSCELDTQNDLNQDKFNTTIAFKVDISISEIDSSILCPLLLIGVNEKENCYFKITLGEFEFVNTDTIKKNVDNYFDFFYDISIDKED